MILVAMSSGYWGRLIFWGRVAPRYQDKVRTALIAFLATGLPLAGVTLLLAATQGDIQSTDTSRDTIFIACFTAFGVLCQISTVIWLLRYRQE